jgi:hypothetical protein
MVKGGVALIIGGVQRASILQQKRDHGDRSDGCSAVNRILAPAIANTCRCLVVDENASDIEVSLGGDKM